MEYVKVIYPTNRTVYIDDENCGKTNQVLRVDAGTHQFDLGNLANYTPAFCKVSVVNTNVLTPMEIIFKKKDS